MSKKNDHHESENSAVKIKTCGIIMPISHIGEYSAEHWSDVKIIIQDCTHKCNLESKIVSDADDSGLIHQRIIQNLYNNELIICDVSAKNPNVMFELGLRLAFDKPTIIIKDDRTDYSFDTGVIEHLEYPADLRFNKIIKFKEYLIDKIRATILKSESDPNYSTFLKHYGNYKISNLEQEEISKSDYIIKRLENIEEQVNSISRNKPSVFSDFHERRTEGERVIGFIKEYFPDMTLEDIQKNPAIRKVLDNSFKQKPTKPPVIKFYGGEDGVPLSG